VDGALEGSGRSFAVQWSPKKTGIEAMVKRTTKVLVLAGIILLGGLGTGIVIHHSGQAATSTKNGNANPDLKIDAFYLAVGASGSLGYQPMGEAGGREHATKTSYTNDLVRIEAARGVQLELTQIGCPGETMVSMLSAVDHCYPVTNGQLAHAVTFLKAHSTEIGLVTIDLGFNDVRKCLTRATVDQGCIRSDLSGVKGSMAKVLSTLQAAAGPRVHFVGLLTDDPFLAHYLNGANGRIDSAFTLQTIIALNQILRANYSRAKIPVADVETAFKTKDQTLQPLPGFSNVPTNVAMVCKLTWMCKKAPWGPDDHPNGAGFLVIAGAVAAQLRAPW